MKKALIFGVTGQDGAYLSRFLLKKGYEVHGVKRRSSSLNTSRVDDLYTDPHFQSTKFFLHYGDMTDSLNICRLLQLIKPNEIYNLAAQSHVKVSFDIPDYTAQVDALGTLRVLDIIKNHRPDTKFYQASTSELFGKVVETPQTEKTPFYPRSPYGVAKLYAYWIIKNYRESYGLFATNGILFNHESPRRGETFISKKVTLAATRIKAGLQEKLIVGNLESRRDWGYAPEFVHGMWLMLQQDSPEDLILSTGETHSVREFIELSFNLLDINLVWEGENEEEVGIDRNSGKTIVSVDSKYFRPSEVNLLEGDPSRAKKILGWEPKVKFEKLVQIMIKSDWDELKK